MRVFVKVAECGGFAGAARALHMSPPAVTRAIARLETLIGTRLLTRTTRSVKLTEAGAQYLEDCRRILAEIEEAEAAAAGSYLKPSGTLAVSAPVLFGQLHVLPILNAYIDRFPEVTVRTLFVDRIINLVEEGIDAAVRIAHLPDAGYAAIRVGAVRRVVCAAPEYLARHGVPARPEDLRHHRVITGSAAWNLPEWRFGIGGRQRVPVRPNMFCNTNQAALSAAMAGVGITRLLSYQIAPALAERRLCELLVDHEDLPIPVHVVHPEGRRAPAKTRAFVDMAVESLRMNPAIGPV